MSFKQTALYPVNPTTTRGTATKISSHKDKVVYANGRSIIVRVHRLWAEKYLTDASDWMQIRDLKVSCPLV
jgi:hypothetical protein